MLPQPRTTFHRRTPILTALTAILLICWGVSAHAQPDLTVDPRTTTAGGVVLLTIENYTPGDYDATILFDGVDQGDFHVPAGGELSTFWQIPTSATAGGHTIEVCAACDQGDLEQTDTVSIHVGTGQLSEGDWNAQVEAIEVTQGVRGDIPRREPPSGSLILPADDAVMVANRRTVVRAYPWLEAAEGMGSEVLDAQLFADVGGTTLGPIDPVGMVRVSKYDTFEDRRRDASKTWNFVLPEDWVQLGISSESKTMKFTVEVNPWSTTYVSGEHSTSDNTVSTGDYEFRHVGINNAFAMRFRPFLLKYLSEDESTVLRDRTTVTELAKVVESFHDILPIGDGLRGIRLYPWRYVDWAGPTEEGDRDLLDEHLIRTYLPTGTLEGNPPNDYYGFLADGSHCSGHANLNTPFLITGACPEPTYVAAHELTHAIGREHAGNGHGEAGGGGYDASYPGDHGQVESDTWGFHVYDMIAYSPDDPDHIEGVRHDYMSYAPEIWVNQQWVSQYIWNHVAADLGESAIATKGAPIRVASAGATGPAAKQGDMLMLTGWFDGNQLDVSPMFALPAVQTSGGNAPFLLEFHDENGNLLATSQPSMHSRQDTTGAALVSGVLDVPTGWTRMVVTDGQNVLQQLDRSANAPTCSWVSPQGFFQWGGQGTQTLEWSGDDADGDPLTYRVVGLRDGTDRHVLASDLSATSYDLDLSRLPGGGPWELWVEVSDGLRCGSSSVLQGWAAPKAPRPLIVFPQDGETYHVDVPLLAQGLYADFQDAVTPSDMQWLLDGQNVGTGASLELPSLTAGSHTLTLQADNSHNLTGSMQIQFDVVDQLGLPAVQSPQDGSQGLSGTVDLQWSEVPGATRYRLQVFSDPNMGELVLERSDLSEPGFSFEIPWDTLTYTWRVQAEAPGAVSGFTQASFTAAASTAAPSASTGRYALQASPNPFNPRTTISFELPRAAQVRLELFDLSGRRVRTLTERPLSSGAHEITWNGEDDSGDRVSSGVYLVRLSTPRAMDSLRVVLLK